MMNRWYGQRIASVAILILAVGLSAQTTGEEASNGLQSKKIKVSTNEAPDANQSVEGSKLPTQPRSSSDLFVKVEQPQPLFPFLNVRRPVRPSISGGQIAIVDSNGQLVLNPSVSQFPRPVSRRRVVQPFAFRGISSAGGIGVDASHIRVYSYATVDADGRVRIDCVQGGLEDARKAVTAGNDDAHRGHDHESERKATK